MSALNDTYDLGNSSNKFSEIFSTYFRGTADVAVNSQNLGSVPAANYRLVSDSFTQSRSKCSYSPMLILLIQVDYYPNIRVTNGSTSFVQEDGNVDIRGDGNITVSADTTQQKTYCWIRCKSISN